MEGPGCLSVVTEATQILVAIEQANPRATELVELRYFAGLSFEETATCLGISSVTAKRHWAVARAWLYAALSDGEATGPDKSISRESDPPPQ